MYFLTSSGKTKSVSNPSKYIIKWDEKSRSQFQFRAKQFLKNYWEFDRVFEEFSVAGTQMHFDFYNHSKRIVVEIHGRQHSKFVKHFHGTRIGYRDQIKRDLEKIAFCEINAIKMVEIFEESELTEEFFKEQGIKL